MVATNYRYQMMKMRRPGGPIAHHGERSGALAYDQGLLDLVGVSLCDPGDAAQTPEVRSSIGSIKAVP
jgi:hypothetical protein